MLRIPFVLALVALLVPSAAAEPVVETKTVNPGRFYERDIPLQKGERVAWRIVIEPGQVGASYDIHSHGPQGTEPVIHAQGVVNGTLAATFTAPSAGNFSWMITNSDGSWRKPINVTLSTEVMPPLPKASPAPDAAWSLLALAAVAMLALRPRRPDVATAPAPF